MYIRSNYEFNKSVLQPIVYSLYMSKPRPLGMLETELHLLKMKSRPFEPIILKSVTFNLDISNNSYKNHLLENIRGIHENITEESIKTKNFGIKMNSSSVGSHYGSNGAYFFINLEENRDMKTIYFLN